jgi:predicted DNA-binding ribbon-helix-helix protein
MRSPKPKSVKRSIDIDGYQTSISLENHFWEALKEIAKERGATVKDLVAAIKAEQGGSNLSSAIRIFVTKYYGARRPWA